MNIAVRHASALLAMVLGSAAVLGGLYGMNELTKPPAPEPPKVAKDFKIEQVKKKKETPKPQPQQRPRKAAPTARRAPAPNITTALSGMSFDLPQFQSSDVLGTDKLLSGAGGNKNLVHDQNSVDSQAKPRVTKHPTYPKEAQHRGIEGRVVLKLLVSADGRVEQVKVLESNPVGIFEEVAIAAVRQWQFEPAYYKGEPVSQWTELPMPFQLN